MSYDIGLYEDGKPVRVDLFAEGGTQVMGGSDQAELNITYNYSWFYTRYLSKQKGIRALYGKTGAQAIPMLKKAVAELGTNRYESDYWAPTPGNAGYALNILLGWAKKYPQAIFNGD